MGVVDGDEVGPVYSRRRGLPRRVVVEPHILLYAFRYALGSRTHAAHDVADLMEAHAAALMQYRTQIVEDINAAITMDAAGERCDVERWERVRARFA